jgi:hypothetical protein
MAQSKDLAWEKQRKIDEARGWKGYHRRNKAMRAARSRFADLFECDKCKKEFPVSHEWGKTYYVVILKPTKVQRSEWHTLHIQIALNRIEYRQLTEHEKFYSVNGGKPIKNQYCVCLDCQTQHDLTWVKEHVAKMNQNRKRTEILELKKTS